MLAKIHSCGIAGLDVFPVTIEVDAVSGLPATIIVGLPDNAIKESKERVRSAIKNSGFKYPARRITINLSPADIKKEGPAFDLAIALAILAATEQIPRDILKNFVILGEVALDGTVRPVSGVLPIALSLRKETLRGLIVPVANAAEAVIAEGVKVYCVRNLLEAVNLLTSDPLPPECKPGKIFTAPEIDSEHDFADVKGQQSVKRALEIAAAGSHNILLIGPPGSGKTMLARRLPGILPEMTLEESIETTRIHSIMGLIPPGAGLIRLRPFRSPHHTSSDVALVGGGANPKPGEVTLSHNGILFLDELPEFNRNVLESLRQPLEDHCVTIARAIKAVRFPARFMLLAAMNPCPCGLQYHQANSSLSPAFGGACGGQACRCTPAQIEKYRSKISGPLLDRIDIHLDVPAVHYHELSNRVPAESSAQIRARVNTARAIQIERLQRDGGGIVCNAQMSHKQVHTFCALGKAESDLLRQAMTELNFSARAYDKILKVSRTIADLDGSEQIQTAHLAEAIQYRSLDRNFF